MLTAKPMMTVAAFDAFAALPANRDKRLELIDGVVYGAEEPPMVSSPIASMIAVRLSTRIMVYLETHPNAPKGRVTGADGGYQIGPNRVIPDVAFYRVERLPESVWSGYLPIAPELAIEVTSLTDRPGEISQKIGLYLAAGVVVWQVHPDVPLIEVHQPNAPTVRLHGDAVLVGDPVLPGFRLPLPALFADL